MVDTIDPVSTRQEVTTPPMLTPRWGQDDMSLDTSMSPAPEIEPVTAPSELWLCSSVGASFPAPGWSGTAYWTEKVAREAECEQEHGPHRTLWLCDLVADSAYK